MNVSTYCVKLRNLGVVRLKKNKRVKNKDDKCCMNEITHILRQPSIVGLEFKCAIETVCWDLALEVQ